MTSPDTLRSPRPTDADDVFATLSVPPERPADSFVLHAPLELTARSSLHGLASPAARPAILGRIHAIAADWAACSPPLDNHTRPPVGADPEGSLRAAAASGDFMTADAAYVSLCRTTAPDRVLDLLAELTHDRLGGAAHAAIFVDQIGRLPEISPNHLLAGRALLIDVVRGWDRRIEWIDGIDEGTDDPQANLLDQLLDVPSPGDPGSNFIFPTMSIVDRTGLARELIAPTLAHTTAADARVQLLRLAAHSMLQDDPAHAPYGWTHCLTMPQATLNLAPRLPEPSRAVAVAATYVCGFRGTLSTTPIDPTWEPEPVDPGLALSLATPDQAAGLLWQATTSDRPRLVQELIDVAGAAEDAHLVKYTEACLTAAGDDPDAAHLFHAAMAYLGAWWIQSGA
jgi:hypothetical protein